MKLLRTVLQCIYPSLCRSCNAIIPPADIFCTHCIAKIRPLPSLILHVTNRMSMKVFAVSKYQAPVRDLVVKKFHGDILASRQLARLILAFTPLRTLPVDYLVPVPLHWTRYASRGFNQAYEMSMILGRDLGVPTKRLVSRRRKTIFQWKLSVIARQENVKNAFDLNHWYILAGTDWVHGKHIVLLDDLCTTGATLTHVAKVIAECNPASLTAVVGCRTI